MKVTLAYVHSTELASSFVDSVEALRMHDLVGAGHLAHEYGEIKLRCGTDGLVAARNMAAAAFVASDSEWLLWVDTDMGFRPDTLDRLLEVADPTGRPIMGALCFASREVEADGMGGYRTAPRPTIYDYRDVDGVMRFAGRAVYPVNAVVPSAATGSACVLIHRSVFERIGDGGWYNRLPGSDGSLLGEDVSFCVRAGAEQIPVFVHTGVRTTHCKPQWVGEADFWRALDVPPATDEVDIVVPVMGRPQNAAPFMASLRASTGLATVYAVAHLDDQETVTAWKEAGARVLAVTERTFAEKVNATRRYDLRAPWLFLVGDDVAFRPGWLDHAQYVAKTQGAQVVGTNDLGNPRVLAGEHGTHLLISRAYVAEVGASWDGPGVVCHDGYRHWFVDDEIVTAAKQRGTWGMALGSIVEHLHPAWGKSEMDAVYELGQSHQDADRRTFAARLAASTR